MDIAVVGAGLAGLAAAWRLAARGRSVVVLEARDRPGGRVRTRRMDAQREGPPVEAGAARVRDDHLWTRAFLRQAAVPTAPFYPTRGHMVVAEADGRWRPPPSLPPWSCHRIVAARSWPDHDHWTSDGPEGDGSPDVMSWRRQLTGTRWLRAGGGMDRLPRALADALGSRIRYGAHVKQVVTERQGTRVRFATDEGGAALAARRVVCAVPLTLLDVIDFDPPMPDARRELQRSVPYESAVRTFVHVRCGEWLPRELNGFGRSGEVGEIWYTGPTSEPTEGDDGPRRTEPDGRTATFTAYCQGPKARRLASLAPERRIRETVEALDAMFPGVREAVVDAHTMSWEDERWSRGAQARTWDVDPWPVPELRKPHGPVHFAGEHLATPGSAGWMDGALESGWTVAGAVADRLDREG